MILQIEQEETGKGRQVSGQVLGYLVAGKWWPYGDGGNNIRPILMVVGSSEAQIRPLVANLKMGKRALLGGGYRPEKLEFLKTSKIAVSYQRQPSGVIATLVAPDVFTQNPGMVDPSEIKFILLSDQKVLINLDWNRASAVEVVTAYRQHVIDSRPKPEYDSYYYRSRAVEEPTPPDLFLHYLDHTPLFGCYLDHRTRCPLIDDIRFLALLLYRCLDSGLAVTPADGYRSEWGQSHDLKSVGLTKIGFAPVLGFRAQHEEFENILNETTLWFVTRYLNKSK